MPISQTLFSSQNTEWETPQWLYEAANREYGPFHLDAAASPDNAKCQLYYTEREDGLSQLWLKRVWLNPPYNSQNIVKWLRKAWTEVSSGRTDLVCVLLPSRTSTRWFHRFVLPYAQIVFLSGRLRFLEYQREERLGKELPNSAPFDSILAIYRSRSELYKVRNELARDYREFMPNPYHILNKREFSF